MSKTKQRSYEWHGSFVMAALSAIQDFWNSDPQYARAKDWANLVEWTIPAEDEKPLPFTWGSIDETDIDNIVNFTHLHNTIRCTIVLTNHTRCIKAHSSHLPSSQPSVPSISHLPPNLLINGTPEGALSMAMTLVCPLFNTNKLTKNCVRLNMGSFLRALPQHGPRGWCFTWLISKFCQQKH